MPRLRDNTAPLADVPALNPMLRLLGAFWTPARLDDLRRMKRAKLLPSAIARRIGTTPGEVRRALQALGLDPTPPGPTSERGSILAKVVLERRLLALASPTGHAVADLARFGVAEAGDAAF